MNKAERLARAILWLRISYWIGAVTDAMAAIAMLLPSLGAMVYGLSDFTPGPDYRYAMGSAASLMLGWTALLLWADRAPAQRRFVLVLTVCPVILGLVVSEIVAIHAGFLSFALVVPTFVLQLVLSLVFLGSYIQASKVLPMQPHRVEAK
jgi:hypothetical protein